MKTPICDFVAQYAKSNALRLHMPGHKGVALLGMERMDITEIHGADSLYEADGIIRESETNASELFGAHTFYSTEGSSLCIRAMLYLASLHAGKGGGRIAAGRNAHKTFLSAAALLDLEVDWLYPRESASYLACKLSASDIEEYLNGAGERPVAVYLTSPDYLGNTADLKDIARVCHANGVLLLVDHAHGAYMKFLPVSRHPMDLGADLCCDSAHKTLPALTGAAYLHVSQSAPALFRDTAKQALAMFGSTSPSYLILQSLDAVNGYLAEGYRERLAEFCRATDGLKQRLAAAGYTLVGDEPLKITVLTKSYGYTGVAFSSALEQKGIVCEFADPDFCVMMLTPEVGEEGLARLEQALLSIPSKDPVVQAPPPLFRAERVLPIREAALTHSEEIPVEKSIGRILAVPTVGCPPAVPIVVCGERITKEAIACFDYYGIDTCRVVIKN